KILLGWNALTVAALARGYEATRHAAYREDAIRLMQYLLRTFPTDDGKALYRVATQGQVHHPALLQDYAFFIQALVATYRVTWDIFWLKQALEWAEKAMEQFADPDGALFFLNPSWQRDLLVRTKETH
ncbi:hypothetical protein RZS08_26090, partial [Arthrospira platensis SPKY1]|nr:hypothetical protein [Arthrospira platensis SPKY1]